MKKTACITPTRAPRKVLIACLSCVFLQISMISLALSQATLIAPSELSLGEAQKLALANHPDIKINAFDINAAHEGIKIARSVYEPQAYATAIQAFAPPSTRIGAYNALSDPTILQRTSFGVGVQQYVTDFGRTTALVKASEAEFRAQFAQGQQSKNIVLLNVTQAYFEVLRSMALLEVARQTVKERQLVLTRAEALQKAGLRSMLDVSIAARDTASARQEVIQAQARQTDSLADFAQALGFNTPHPYKLKNIDTIPALPTLIPLLENALQNNPLLSVAQAQAAVERLRAAAAERSSYPTLNAYGFLGLNPIRDQNETMKSSYQTIGLNLTIPIFTGGELEASRRQAEDRANAASLAIRKEENQLLHDVRLGYTSVETARGEIELSKQILGTSNEALRLTEARYRIGLSSIVEVSQAQLSEAQAAIDATNAKYDYLIGAAALEFSTGLIAQMRFTQ